MSTTPPRQWVVYDTSIQAHHILTTPDEISPPCILNVLLQLHAERPIIKEHSKDIVYLAGGKDYAPTVDKGNGQWQRQSTVTAGGDTNSNNNGG